MNAPPHPRLHCRWTDVGQVGAAACQQPDAFGVARMGWSRNAPDDARFRQADFADPAYLPAALKCIEVAVGLQRRPAAKRFRDQHRQRLPRARRSSRRQTASPKRKPATTGSFGRLHAKAENPLRDSGMGWTHIPPVFAMRTSLFFADSIKGGKPIAATRKGKVV